MAKDIIENSKTIIFAFASGLWIGFLPGMGSGISNMVAYGYAKGISKDDLAQAAPSPQEVKRLTQYASNRQSAEQHARSNRLQKRNMAYLDPADGKRN